MPCGGCSTAIYLTYVILEHSTILELIIKDIHDDVLYLLSKTIGLFIKYHSCLHWCRIKSHCTNARKTENIK